MGGTSDSTKSRLATSGLCRYFAAIVEVVPPHIMCFPSFEKKRDIILSQSSLFDGGPKSIFIGERFLILTTQAVASSPG